ncbi:amidase [Acetobacteraceae bacterium KSS8]|uniref:Amidase n=1 Tax=Endosaccharibacter trunci TaxID=2812733 RepID=A0ABT1W967_9PROT|nr:amidase [Acetobacteraceae bacterium KSS8]
MTALWELSATAAAELLCRGEISSVELTESCIARAQVIQPLVHAYITPTFEHARNEAVRADAMRRRGEGGSLCGIPYAVKDTYFTADIPTTAGSRAPLNRPLGEEATIVTRMRAAGAVLMGKLNTWEFGTGTGEILPDLPYPIARNPWDPRYFTGGSSSGCGAVVPAGGALLAFGSDTGGSIRYPAAACGLIGLKPTYGRVSRAGLLPNSYSLDVAGPLGWTTSDCAHALQAVAGRDPRDPVSTERSPDDFTASLENVSPGLRIGLLTDCFEPGMTVDADIARALDAAADCLRALGFMIVPVHLPHDRLIFRDCMRVINSCESAAIHRDLYAEWQGLMGRALKDKIVGGLQIAGVDYVTAIRWRRTLSDAVSSILADVDAILTFGTTTSPPPLDDARAVHRFTLDSNMAMASVSGHPALSFCTGLASSGLPLNAQLIGRHFAEGTLLMISHAYETATNWRPAKPVLLSGTAEFAASPAPGPDTPQQDHVRADAMRRSLDASITRLGPAPRSAEPQHIPVFTPGPQGPRLQEPTP